MTVVLPLYGYVERQHGEVDGVRNNPGSAVNDRRIKAVSDFCRMIRYGLDNGHAVRFADLDDQKPDGIHKSGETFKRLHQSGLFFEKDTDKRPELQELIRRCTEIRNGEIFYKQGAIVITKVDDIFHEAYDDVTFSTLNKLVEMSVPVFAVEDGEFQDVINQVRRQPKNSALYGELVDLSLDYRKKMKNLLRRREKERVTLE